MRSACRSVGALAMGVLFFTETSSRADEGQVRCKAAYERAQELRRDGRLGGAEVELRICVETCPRRLVPDCERWLREIHTLMPTVRLQVRDEGGQPIGDVRVIIDGRPLVGSPGSDAIVIEPGDHLFRFERTGSVPVEVRVTLEPAERDHVVTATLAATDDLTKPRSGRQLEDGGGSDLAHDDPRAARGDEHLGREERLSNPELTDECPVLARQVADDDPASVSWMAQCRRETPRSSTTRSQSSPVPTRTGSRPSGTDCSPTSDTATTTSVGSVTASRRRTVSVCVCLPGLRMRIVSSKYHARAACRSDRIQPTVSKTGSVADSPFGRKRPY